MTLKLGTGNKRSDATRMALIGAATEVFARSGFEAVGTRDIATTAGVHPALIGYHFGGKEGLYLAVFGHLADSMEQRIGPALSVIDQAMGVPGTPHEVSARCLELLGHLCEAMLATLADEASGPWGPLMMREQQAPTAAFDLVYERFMKRVLDIMTRLAKTIDPGRSEESVRLAVVGLMGQMMVFRVARAGALRHLGWKQLGKKELSKVQAAFRENLARLLTCPPPK